MKTLVLGMGNPIVMDDGVGIRLADDLRREFGNHPDLDWFTDCSMGGLELLDRICGYDRLIVLDSIRTTGGRPGDVYRFDAAALRDTLHLTNVHDANFATVLELGRRIGRKLPADSDIHIFAVEVAETETFGEHFSAALELAYPSVRESVIIEVRELLGF